MDRAKWPIVGQFVTGRYLIVRGREQRDELELLGHFGRDAHDIKRKDESRRGPEDCRILEFVKPGHDETLVVLSPHEAFFLTYAIGCLDIKSDQAQSMDIDTCWTELRKYLQGSHIKTDFAIEFGVYHYCRTRGWIVKSGHNYGTNFLLYKDSPASVHSSYAVLVVQAGQKNPEWPEVLTHSRVIQSVSKELLMAVVYHPTGVFDRPSCIKDMRVRFLKVAGGTNLSA